MYSTQISTYTHYAKCKMNKYTVQRPKSVVKSFKSNGSCRHSSFLNSSFIFKEIFLLHFVQLFPAKNLLLILREVVLN